MGEGDALCILREGDGEVAVLGGDFVTDTSNGETVPFFIIAAGSGTFVAAFLVAHAVGVVGVKSGR